IAYEIELCELGLLRKVELIRVSHTDLSSVDRQDLGVISLHTHRLHRNTCASARAAEASYLPCTNVFDPVSNSTSILVASFTAVAMPRPKVGCSKTSPSSYRSFGE